MPTWSTELPTTAKHMGFDLRRTPPASPLGGIATSPDLIVVATHYYHGRTTPCEAPDCPACRESIPFRTHVYISLFDPKKCEHFLFECTAAAAKPLAEHRTLYGTLRGASIHASRPKCRPNAKVYIQTNTIDIARVHLPEPPDIQKALCVIWRIPLPATDLHHLPNGTPTVRVRSARLRPMRDQPDNAGNEKSMAEILAGNGNTLSPAATP
jgi:hypothetical protein